MLFQAKLFKGVLPGPGEGTQLPTKSGRGWAPQGLPQPSSRQSAALDTPSRVPSSGPGSGMLAMPRSLSGELIRITDKQPGVQAVQLRTV